MEYKRIQEQGAKLATLIKEDMDGFTNEELAEVFDQLHVYKLMMDNWQRAYDTKSFRGLIKEMNVNEAQKLKGNMSEFRWVTINPEDGKEVEFIKKVHKFMKRPMMKGEYVFEQRDVEFSQPTKGLHVHALVKFYPNLVRDVQAQMKDFCDKNHIKIMTCSEEDVSRRRVYMGGVKEGEEKMKKAQADKKMRQFYSLESIYTC